MARGRKRTHWIHLSWEIPRLNFQIACVSLNEPKQPASKIERARTAARTLRRIPRLNAFFMGVRVPGRVLGSKILRLVGVLDAQSHDLDAEDPGRPRDRPHPPLGGGR